VAIDLSLSDDLLAEGFARELVNKIQNMRKSANLEVTDRIRLGISHSDQADKALKKYGNYIKNETLAVELNDEVNRKIKQEWDINGVATLIAFDKT
jgi:isoleucyl-tRNA synthetase